MIGCLFTFSSIYYFEPGSSLKLRDAAWLLFVTESAIGVSGASHQRYKNTRILGLPEERMLQKLGGSGSLRWIAYKHSLQKALKSRAHLTNEIYTISCTKNKFNL